MVDRVQKLTDLKKLTIENQKLIEETLTLAWKNRTSLEISAEVYWTKLQVENQKLIEEVLTLTRKNNAALEIQSELYKKVNELRIK
ncbi:unnamed protein product [Thlaspi arvense]|uniref:Uncharacterized protein n=1 Tax=Thlaspi arvense TaxID=13288 RepID=A0AAU9RH12_THLAR|nr:unnamed protein product [Thlaspi arvense]